MESTARYLHSTEIIMKQRSDKERGSGIERQIKVKQLADGATDKTRKCPLPLMSFEVLTHLSLRESVLYLRKGEVENRCDSVL